MNSVEISRPSSTKSLRNQKPRCTLAAKLDLYIVHTVKKAKKRQRTKEKR